MKNSPKQRGRKCATEPVVTPKKQPPLHTFQASRASQVVNCFGGTCGRCRECQGHYSDPERWLGGS